MVFKGCEGGLECGDDVLDCRVVVGMVNAREEVCVCLVLFVGDMVGLVNNKPCWCIRVIRWWWLEAHGDAADLVVCGMRDGFIEVCVVGSVCYG